MRNLGYYEDEANESFFSYNPGLARRFPFNFVIKPYTEKELMNIFIKLAKDDGWRLEEDAIKEDDLKDKDIFNNAGGDMENLLVKSIMAHYENNFLTSEKRVKVITRADILKGIEAYKSNKKTTVEKKSDPPPPGMYS